MSKPIKTIHSLVAFVLLSASPNFSIAAEHDAAAAAQTPAAAELPAADSVFTIVSVDYVGNRVTRKRLLDQQLLFVAPAEITGQALIDSLQGMRDLGLFSTVIPTLTPAEGGYALSIEVDEKFYIVPLPRIGLNSDGETSYGASIEWDNVAGLNQRIKLVWERRQLKDAELGEREIFRLNYDYPRVAGSLWNAGFFTNNSRVPVEEEPADGGRIYVSEQQRHGVSVGRQLAQRGQTKGWFIDGSLFYLLNDNTPRDRVPELAGGSTWAVSLGARFTDRHLLTYSELGLSYGFGLELSLPVGSPDFSYNMLSANLRWVRPGFKKASHHSSIYRAGLGIYNGGIPETQAFGNSSGNLRGLKKGELEGNALVYGSYEYLMPVAKNHPSWRWGGFLDAALFADDYGNFKLNDLSYSVGVALVWRPRKLVKVEIRGEYGYNIDQATARTGGGIDRF